MTPHFTRTDLGFLHLERAELRILQDPLQRIDLLLQSRRVTPLLLPQGEVGPSRVARDLQRDARCVSQSRQSGAKRLFGFPEGASTL